MNEYKQYPMKEMREAMEAGHVLAFEYDSKAYLDDLDKYNGPFVIESQTGIKQRLDGAWDAPCIILPKKETRYMTQAEAVAFAVNTPGIVVRQKVESQWYPYARASFHNPKILEWTTCTIDGVYGEPHEFVKEVEV